MHALPHRRSNALAALAFSGLLAFAVSFSLAMAALHRAPLWRVVLSLPALFLAGLVFAIPGLDLNFGPRLSVQVHPPRLDLWID